MAGGRCIHPGGSSNYVLLDNFVAIFDQILDRNVKVREGSIEPRDHHLLNACVPVASNGVCCCTSGSKTSSIVCEMSSASRVFVASRRRLMVALLLVSWAADICFPPRVDVNVRVAIPAGGGAVACGANPGGAVSDLLAETASRPWVDRRADRVDLRAHSPGRGVAVQLARARVRGLHEEDPQRH